MNYGLHHGYYARSLGANVSLLTPGGGLDYGISPALTARLQTKPPNVSVLTPKPPMFADAAPSICLNQSQNSVACTDPNCTYGDCGAPAGVQQVTVGSLCLDQTENQIDCTDPNCTYGDCVSASFWSKSSIITGVPDIAIYAVLAVVLFGGGFGAGRR